MVGFFDLNIPYLEIGPSDKPTRLKLVVKAMELGYTGVAYNRTIKGVMSESDRCSISLFPLSSLLKLSPSLISAIKLHRDLLNVATSSPFRQYTRLTVSVDGPSQASALNSGNPILKTYNLVAARPLNQNAFDQACQVYEVDIIAIDFSERLPFRLKLPMVKAAIGRGVYFEITYSKLIADVQARRQMISNAKLLVDWTRGKNIIFSSAASSVNEIRGPYDVANLLSLLGFSTERAKAAISKNCRSLIANALRKKQCYKDTIRVELISSNEQIDSNKPWFGDWLKWDPISSGEGDLLIDDMAKFFSASSKVSKTVKAIDFASVVDGKPSHGLKVKDLISGTKVESQPLNNAKYFLSTAEESEVSVTTDGVSGEPDRLKLLPKSDQTSLNNTPLEHQISGCEDSTKSFSPNDTLGVFTNAEEITTHSSPSREEPKNLNGLDVYFARIGTEMHDLQSQNRISSSEANVVLPEENIESHSSAWDIEFAAACNAFANVETSTPSKENNFSAFHNEESKRSNSLDVVLGAQNVAMDEVLTEIDIKSQADISLVSCDVSLHEDFLDKEQFREPRDDAVLLADGMPVVESYDEMKGNDDSSITNYELLEEVTMEGQEQGEDHTEINYPTLDKSTSGKGRVKRRTPHGVVLFPFKRSLNPVPFKKKARKFKNKVKMV